MKIPDFLKPYIGPTVAVLVIGGLIGFGALRWKHNVDEQHQTEIANQQRQFEQITKDLYQAKNSIVTSQQQMFAELSLDYQRKLKEQKQEILAKITGQIDAQINPINAKVWELQPGVFQFPKPGETHPIINKLTVDTVKRPADFEVSFKPQEIKFDATLNFSEKDKTMSFWVEPQSKNVGGMELKVSKLELKPSDQMNAWITDLRGHKTYLPEMPKYTAGILAGVGTNIQLNAPNNDKHFYVGGMWQKNTASGFGFPIIGLTNGNNYVITTGIVYSWGKRVP
jgi:type II secretory pathway pseudopilin PulG